VPDPQRTSGDIIPIELPSKSTSIQELKSSPDCSYQRHRLPLLSASRGWRRQLLVFG
jgi:hypothetical protein